MDIKNQIFVWVYQFKFNLNTFFTPSRDHAQCRQRPVRQKFLTEVRKILDPSRSETIKSSKRSWIRVPDKCGGTPSYKVVSSTIYQTHGLYEDLRNSGGLKLPSGRLLSDWFTRFWMENKPFTEYENIVKEMKSPKTRKTWWTDIQRTKNKGKSCVWLKKLGTNWFHRFTRWRNIRRKDMCRKTTDTLATHVVMYYKFSFEACFSNSTALQLIEVIFCCCDGASSNRSFIMLNIDDKSSSYCENKFSGMPLFFLFW
jgi:hypothetical protein